MTAVVAQEFKERAVQILGEWEVAAQVIGRVIEIPTQDKRVVIEGDV